MALSSLSVLLSFQFLANQALSMELVRKEVTAVATFPSAATPKDSEIQASALPSVDSIVDKMEHLEQHFGGLVRNVPRTLDAWKPILSEDGRSVEQIVHGPGRIGGDRFCGVDKGCHGYGPVYAKYLQHLLKEPFDEQAAIAEVGILKGSGLGVWSTLFPRAAIHGFDIDLKLTQDNMAFLKQQGAFATGDAQLDVYDMYKDNTDLVKQKIGQRKLVFVAEDGGHTDKLSAMTFDSFYPSLSGDWVYTVEDAIHYTGEFEKHMMDKYVTPRLVEMHREKTGDDVLYVFTRGQMSSE